MSTSGQGLSHPHRNNQTRNDCEDTDDNDRRYFTQSIGDDAGENGDYGVARVAPEAVDPDRAGPPGEMGYAADGGQECGVNEGGTELRVPWPVTRRSDMLNATYQRLLEGTYGS